MVGGFAMGGLFVALSLAVGLVYVSYRRLQVLDELQSRAQVFVKSALPPSKTERRHWMADINEMTLDLSHVLARPTLIPKVCARIAFSAGGLVAIVLVASSVQSEGASSNAALGWQLAALAFIVGAVGAFGCLSVGRVAERKAGKLREEWNTLIRRSTQDVPT